MKAQARSKNLCGGIKRKLATFIGVSIFIIMVLGISAGYMLGAKLLVRVIGDNQSKTAELIATYISESLENEAEHIIAYAGSPLWQSQIEKENLKYKGLTQEGTSKKLLNLDKKWIDASPGSDLLKEYLENPLGLRLKKLEEDDQDISEIFVTDKYGGLVAASNKTSDFYQADEGWWQQAFDGGRGKVFVGDISFDESRGNWVLIIAVPIRAQGAGVIGICKAGLVTKRFFGRLESFKMGRTGRAALIDQHDYIVYHRDLRPWSIKFADEESLKKLRKNGFKSIVIGNSHLGEGRILCSSSQIQSRLLAENGISWRVLISQDINEVFAPLRALVFLLIIIATLVIIITIPLSYFFASLFAKPIHRLHLATERVIDGKWDMDLGIEVKTGDEIEQFADTFNHMIKNIKDKQAKLVLARDELKQLSMNLEKKVEGRTKDLSDTQAATMNILEDLSEAKEKLDNYTKELEAKNEELKKLDQLKSDFISTVSHELRTPLSITKEGICLVLDKIPGEINEKQKKILSTSKDNIDRLARIINSLLDISKIEAGKIGLKCESSNLAELINKVILSFEPAARQKGLELRTELGQKEIRLCIDPDKIIQVFTNLIGNSIKFTEKGHIEVKVADLGDKVECVVSDTGIGIAPENLPKVFEKFQQFNREAGPGEKGTGLGLSIVKGIIELHKGTIRVESELGKWTKFTFVIPKAGGGNGEKKNTRS